MPCLAAKARARAGSRAATAVASASSAAAAGFTRAAGAMRAAPRQPIRTRSAVDSSAPGAHQAPRAIAGRLPILHGDLARDERGHIPVGSLDEPATAGREVEHHLGGAQAQAVEVDKVEVGLLAGGHDAAVAEAVEGSGGRRLQAD